MGMETYIASNGELGESIVVTLPALVQKSDVPANFKLRLEARLKNAALVTAREQLGLSAVDVSKQTGICYPLYLNYESMQRYPSPPTQKIICDFYRQRGVFMLEEDVFPESLLPFRPKRKYTSEKSVEQLTFAQISTLEETMLPVVEGADARLMRDECAPVASYVIDCIKKPRDRQIFEKYHGIEGDPGTFTDLGREFGLSTERIRQIVYGIQNKIKKEFKRRKELLKICS